VRKNGELVPVSISISPVHDDKQVVVGASETLRDISEQKRAERERDSLLAQAEAARDLAESATRAKDEFLALVSHELRTPLNAMLGWAQVLQSHPQLSQDVLAKATDAICRNTEIQRQLIEDLLDSARIVSGKLKIDVAPVDLVPVIEAAVDVVRSAARARDIALDIQLPARSGVVVGDATRLQQVFWNILSNAVKFTPKGGRVEVRLDRHETYVRVTISDTGKGIAPEFLPYVFNRYAQAGDDHAGAGHGGLGLGLALVWHLIELHGGQVSVESGGEGQGARFYVDLPLCAIQAADSGVPAQSLLSGSQEVPDIRGVRVLIVDDQASARTLISDVLSSHGCDVTAFATGAEALAYLSSEVEPRVQVLISDIGLAEEDGYSVMRRIRNLEAQRRTSSIPPITAIALTGYDQPEDRILALRAGFQMHLAKPVEPAELIVVIATLLRTANLISERSALR
jgi:signal transduction histidine kinase/CheY-like chemotaxis protein